MPNNVLRRGRLAEGGRELEDVLARLKTVGGTMLDVALAYVRLGLPVFPCSSATKQPLVEQGLYAATVDEASIRAWWRRWPKAMIGMPTGKASGFVVLDCDPAAGQPPEDLVELLRLRAGGTLPPCPIAHTPRGGLHLLFASGPGHAIGNRANLLGAAKGEGKIDVRGDGGYVIVAPSVRHGAQAKQEGCDGCAYEWDRDAGLGDVDPPRLPEALIDLINKPDRELSTDQPRQSRGSPPAGQVGTRERQYALAALDAEARGVETAVSGTRNDRLNKAALKLGQLAAGGWLAQSVIEAALENAAAACGLVQDDGMPSVRRTIASGLRKGLSEPRDLSAVGKPTVHPKRASQGRTERPSEADAAPPEDCRQVIRIKPSLLHEAVDRAEKVLVAAGPGPIYQRGRDLVHVAHTSAMRCDGTEENQEVIVFAESALFSRILARHARCERYVQRDKTWLACDPPPKLAEQYYALSERRLPTLRQLISTPTLRGDGSLLHHPGYDQRTGLYLTSALAGLDVPERPTEDDARRANETLTELLNGFPFSDPACGAPGSEICQSGCQICRPGLSLAVAMAGLIGTVLRPTLPAAPIIAVTAPKAGSGKSYLVDVIAQIGTGSRAVCVATGGDLKEFEKSLSAALIGGRPLLNLDNMMQPLTGQLICMVLSQERVEVRVLGETRMIDAPTGTALFATGNNLAVKGDMTRRTLICKMDAQLEHPENRSFDHDPLAEALRRRSLLVSAALTIARWRHCWGIGAPDPGESLANTLSLSGYSEWCRRVRDPLVALGHVDPILSIQQVRATDSEEEVLGALLEAWHAKFAEIPKTCREAIQTAAGEHMELFDAMKAATRETESVSSVRLGTYIGKVSGRISRQRRFELHGMLKGNRMWRVAELAS